MAAIVSATKPRFPVIASNADRELNRYLYSRVGPDRKATPQEKAAWRRQVLPEFMAMVESPSKAELRMVIERYLPEVDVSRCLLKVERLIVPRERNVRADKPVGKLIPDPEKLPKQGSLSPRLVQLLAALIVCTGRVDYAVGDVVEARVPCRQLGEMVGTSHQYVCELVQTHGERTQMVRRRQPTLCNSGKGKPGINRATGERRGAPAHPATLYSFIVHEQALEQAKAHVAEFGYPVLTYPATVLNEPVQVTPDEVRAAKSEWVGIVTALTADPAVNTARVRLLLNPLEPVCLREEPGVDGRPQLTLTMRGRWHYRAEDLIRRVWPHQLRIMLRPPG